MTHTTIKTCPNGCCYYAPPRQADEFFKAKPGEWWTVIHTNDSMPAAYCPNGGQRLNADGTFDAGTWPERGGVG